MQIKNSKLRYGIIAILLHWFLAVMMLTIVTIGLYMVDLPLSVQKLKFYRWHKELGILVLMLTILRLGWRLSNQQPVLPFTLPFWQKIAAKSTHWLLYFFMLALPLSGWLMTSAAGFPISFFGWVVLPSLVPVNEMHRVVYLQIHQWLAYSLMLVVFIHVAAAFKHHFIDKDDILQRILCKKLPKMT